MKYIVFVLLLTSCIAIKPTERLEFEAPDVYPEGVAYDPARSVYYVSSMRTGAIGKVDLNGRYSMLFSDEGLKSSYGLKIHPDGKQLIVCVSDANYSKYTSPDTRKKMIRLISIDLETGRKIHDVDLATLVQGKHFGNDIAFDDDQNIYMTDSYANAVYKISTDWKPTVFAKHTLFETEGFGLNGIVVHADGFLLVNSSNTGRIYKVDLKDPSKVTKVEIEQYFLGADGMLMGNDNTLILVVNGGNDKIFGLKTNDNWNSAELAATTLVADRFTYPATATMRGNDIWVMNAKTNELMDSTSIPARRFAIQKAVLKPLPKAATNADNK
jgi:sugar lactone lactonase YvrE